MKKKACSSCILTSKRSGAIVMSYNTCTSNQSIRVICLVAGVSANGDIVGAPGERFLNWDRNALEVTHRRTDPRRWYALSYL